MKKNKSNLSRKLLFSFLGAIVAVVMAVTLLGSILSMFWDRETMTKIMYVSQILIFSLIILVCYRIVDKLIVQRIKELNNAMTEVAKGDFETTVEVRGNDEISKLTESFNAMSEELNMNAFLSKDFARYVSHEFKTPLSVIRNYAEITQDDLAQPETAENMEIIISEVERLNCLSKDILELCKLDSTTIIEKKERFSPAAQLRTVILDFQLLWGEKELEIIPELEEFEITSNEALLFRVWQNIVGNAIKFTERGGQISVSLSRTDDCFVCEIADNGIGISDEEKEHIFTPFYSGNRFRNKEGSGLGLSLSQKIVEKLGGTISFESELGKGTTFTVTVPF